MPDTWRGWNSNPDLFNVLALVLDELNVIRGQLTEMLYRADESKRPSDWPGIPLSNRERQVLGLISEGLSNKEVALRLHISESTVKKAVWHATQKLGVRGRTQAMLACIRIGIVDGHQPATTYPTLNRRNP